MLLAVQMISMMWWVMIQEKSHMNSSGSVVKRGGDVQVVYKRGCSVMRQDDPKKTGFGLSSLRESGLK